MKAMEVIRSTNNQRIKYLRSLSGKKGRDTHSAYIAEGYNILKSAPANPKGELFIKESLAPKFLHLADKLSCPATLIADTLFDSVADTVNSGGVLAVFPQEVSKPISTDFVLLLDGIRDAGNAGTIVRTAVAMGVVDIVAIDSVDFYNPKTVRATMGGIFHINPVVADRGDISALLLDYHIAALDMSGTNLFGYTLPTAKFALAVGSETAGISPEVKAIAGDIISIPMPSGRAESLNAAVSASIALAVLMHG